MLALYHSLYEIRIFLLIWAGQLVSLMGSRLTSFGLNLWIYQQTGSITEFGLLVLCSSLPGLLLSPVTGVCVDRWSRRWTMILADSCVGLCTLAIIGLFITDTLSIWTLYGITALSSCFEAFQSTAYLSATTLLVPKEQLIQASGLTRLARAVAKIASPVIAGILLQLIQLPGIMIIDFITLGAALLPLLIVRFPELNQEESKEETNVQSFFEAILYGWQYLLSQPGLLGLMLLLTISNIAIGSFTVLSTPFLLSLTSATGLGIVLSISSCGLVVGSLLMSLWKDQERLMRTLFFCLFLTGFCILGAAIRPSLYLFTSADFCLCLAFPVISGLGQVLFQKKVPPHIQGRVFSLQEPLATVGITLGYAMAGPIDELIFQPLVTQDGNSPLYLFLRQIIGLGPSRDIALFDLVMGCLLVITTFCFYLYPRLRKLEQEIPDGMP